MNRESTGLILVLLSVVLVTLAAIVYLTGAITLAAQWLGLDSSTSLSIDANKVGPSGEVLLHLPPTNGNILISSLPPGTHALAKSTTDSRLRLVDDEGMITIFSGSCASGCTVALNIESKNEVVLTVEYLAKDSEYINDIEVEYLND